MNRKQKVALGIGDPKRKKIRQRRMIRWLKVKGRMKQAKFVENRAGKE